MELTIKEEELIEYAKKQIVKYNTIRHKEGGIDTLYSFILSENGNFYDGACYESNIGQANICGERHAIANMIINESYKSKIKVIIVADPVPEEQKNGTPPCGTCRHLIWTHGNSSTTVLLMQYILTKNGWIFPKIEKFMISDFYPYPHKPKENLWDGFEPK